MSFLQAFVMRTYRLWCGHKISLVHPRNIGTLTVLTNLDENDDDYRITSVHIDSSIYVCMYVFFNCNVCILYVIVNKFVCCTYLLHSIFFLKKQRNNDESCAEENVNYGVLLCCDFFLHISLMSNGLLLDHPNGSSNTSNTVMCSKCLRFRISNSTPPSHVAWNTLCSQTEKLHPERTLKFGRTMSPSSGESVKRMLTVMEKNVLKLLLYHFYYQLPVFGSIPFF